MTLVDNLNLSTDEVENGLEREKKVFWTSLVCPDCGDKMFLYEYPSDNPKAYCRSNLYMEGGCKWTL